MTWIANRLARLAWFGMLWLLRRKPVKWLRRNCVRLLPVAYRDRAWRSVVRQDRFARRWGLRALTWAFTILLASMLITGSYLLVLWLEETGALGFQPSWVRAAPKL